jgi:adenylate kinase family enzyme
MNRIAIIGRSGGGKSTLARALGERLGLPVVHLDVLYWLPGWAKSEREPFRARLAAALAGGRWITDGNFTGHAADLHLAGAEMIVWVDQPRLLCLRRALTRAIRERGHSRSDMADGCDEKIDLEFLAYIWNWDRLTRPQVEAAIAQYAPHARIVRLTTDAQIAAFPATIEAG